jgi:hypothetical protein
MGKIPTAKEILLKHHHQDSRECCGVRVDSESAMIEFAKLHVDAALKAACEKAITKTKTTSGGLLITKYIIDKGSILNSYPLKNII